MSQKIFLKQFNLLIGLAFLSNVCIMALEIVAGRLIAPHVGVSLYTWTTIIGIVLAGISLGSFLGGKLADKSASIQLLAKIFMFSGISALLILPLAYWLPALTKNWNTPLIAEIIFFSLILFLPPCLLMGSISPIIAKLAIKDTDTTGQTIGTIYAAGTIGSIVGTFSTGFFLISHFGTFSIVCSIGLLLISLGVLLTAGGTKNIIAKASLCLILLLCFDAFRASGALKGVCTKETDYYCVRIAEFPLNEICKSPNCKDDTLCKGFSNGKKHNLKANSLVRLLREDNVIQSYNLINSPDEMIHDYEHLYHQGLKYATRKDKTPKTAFIGGGGYTLPIYLDNQYSKIKIDVIEIDPQVTQIVHEKMGLPLNSKVKSHNEDARVFFNRAPKDKYNLIVGDAFKDITVPYQLTTKEFNARISKWLDEDGLYMVNLIDGKKADFKLTRSYLKTLKETFPFLEVIKRGKSESVGDLSSSTIIASKKKIDKSRWMSLEEIETEYEFISQSELQEFINHKKIAKILTDNYAPVEQMTAPSTFRSTVKQKKV
ncbi:MAG: fused MFS/spermidine synthase [Candidatus Caenarcaniphilales bacterium]|nr:fused MFS/spermidine synthase [Candidatus Caenarcaniphilales bacterium]